MSQSRRSIVLTADAARATTPVSPTLIGAFLEDINHAVDGGLNANLVANHSFEGVYLRRGLHTNTVAAVTHRKPRVRIDPLRHWEVRGGAIAVPGPAASAAGPAAAGATPRLPGRAGDAPLVPGSRYARLVSDGLMVLRNAGHGRSAAGIGARRGVVLHLDLLVRRHSFDGQLAARLVDRRGKVLATADLSLAPAPEHPGWERATTSLMPQRNSLAALEIGLHGAGALDVDQVRLIPADHWGAGDPRWSQGVLRRDLVEAIGALKPSFIRFPGGCIVEGLDCANAYDWKRTVGPIAQRRPDYNLWALATRGGDYSQSFQVGYYEYFLLCEDLGARPLPVVGVGMACQLRSSETLPLDSDAFHAVTQDVLDLIDWATGDPATNEWARLRAEAGHPEPFVLDTIALGNENSGAGYLARFQAVREAVRAHRPGIDVVLSAGALAWGTEFEMAWDHARRHPDGVIVDEHFYKSPTWTIDAAARYDDYPRDVRVAVGEYAANLPSGLVPKPVRPLPNSFRSALAEAAFLTGVERNADVVAMTSFAPLLNLVSRGQWEHNLIDFNPFSAMRSANHHVQRMFGATVRERIVPLDDALPEGVLASATAGDDAVVVKLVNTTGRRELVRLRVPGAADGLAEIETLAARDDAQNRLTWDALRGRRKVSPRRSRRHVADGEVTVRLDGRALVVVTVPLAGSPGE